MANKKLIAGLTAAQLVVYGTIGYFVLGWVKPEWQTKVKATVKGVLGGGSSSSEAASSTEYATTTTAAPAEYTDQVKMDAWAYSWRIAGADYQTFISYSNYKVAAFVPETRYNAIEDIVKAEVASGALSELPEANASALLHMAQ